MNSNDWVIIITITAILVAVLGFDQWVKRR
jgi:hypothetical protein